MSNKSDELVLQLLAKVKEKKAKIAAVDRPQWVTSCTVGYNPDVVTDRINIQTVTDVNKLVDLFGFILAKEEQSHKARKALGIWDTLAFKWMGFTVAQWEHDFRSRIAKIQINAEKAELDALEKRIDSLITVEQRRELELQALAKELDV